MPVAGFKALDWPAFYTAQSGFKAPMQLESAAEVAETIRTPILSNHPLRLISWLRNAYAENVVQS